MSTTPPLVPPRSRLRSQAPAPLTSQSSYLLLVDEPLSHPTTPYTPSLSACGSSDRGSPPPMPVSPETDETVVFGRRKKSPIGLGKDPLRVRDGAQARRSSSGVYTREPRRFVPRTPADAQHPLSPAHRAHDLRISPRTSTLRPASYSIRPRLLTRRRITLTRPRPVHRAQRPFRPPNQTRPLRLCRPRPAFPPSPAAPEKQ